MSEIKHTPLPWTKRKLYNGTFFIECSKEQLNKPYGQEILADDYFDDLSKEADCDLILEACNNYYKLKEQNEKLKTALSKADYALKAIIEDSSSKQFKVSARSWQLVNIGHVNACEVLKSCES